MNLDSDYLVSFLLVQFRSVQFSRSVVSDSLRPHESQHARPPCPSPTPGVHSSSCHRVGDAIQPSHPRSSPSPPAPNPSQHQGLFQWVNSSHEVAKALEFQRQHHSLQRNLRADLLQNGLVGSPCSSRDTKGTLVFPILLFSSVSLHWSLRKAFLSLLAILWNLHSDGYIFPFLLCLSLLF